MKKISNDLINYLPISSMMRESDMLTKDESTTLVEIWNHDQKNGYAVPQNVASEHVMSLISKGYIKFPVAYASFSRLSAPEIVHLTKKGTDAVKTIILSSESSTFDKTANNKLLIKTASKQIKNQNWLLRYE